MSLPTITMKGRLTKDIELRWTNSGKAVASFDIACNKNFYNKETNKWEQAGDTLFLHCELWGTPAENLAETTAGKGTEVMVAGELQANNWTDKQDTNRRDMKVRVDTVALTPTRKQQTSQSQFTCGWSDPPRSQAFPTDAPF